MAYGDGLPVLNGATLPRPSAIEEAPEQVGETVTLAGGSERRYDQGERFAVTLSWVRMTETNLAALRTAANRGLLSYTHVDGATYAVMVDGRPSSTPVAGVVPVKFAVSITLRQQTPSV